MTSLSVAVFPKIALFIFFICLTGAAAGSCLSYGHSCWGGHGKRSASLRQIFNPSNHEKRGDEWYLSKLVKLFRERPIEPPYVYKSRIQDSSTFDKFIRNAYQKYPFTESTDNVATRNLELENLDTGERDAQENAADEEAVFEPEEGDFIWTSRFPVYQKKMGNAERKKKNRITLQAEK